MHTLVQMASSDVRGQIERISWIGFLLETRSIVRRVAAKRHAERSAAERKRHRCEQHENPQLYSHSQMQVIVLLQSETESLRVFCRSMVQLEICWGQRSHFAPARCPYRVSLPLGVGPGLGCRELDQSKLMVKFVESSVH